MQKNRVDHEKAEDMAGLAGALLLDLRDGSSKGSAPRASAPTGKALGKEGDARSNDLLFSLLQESFPGDTILSEEQADDLARLDAARVWIIDPLDGTREYGEGRSDWAVHVALVEEQALTAGAVALPDWKVTFSTARPPALPVLSPERMECPRVVVSRTRPPIWAEAVVEKFGGVLLPMGSAGAKAMAVVRGDAEIYLHSGGQWEWDSAAPVAVARAAGLHTSRIDGSPLCYNRRDLAIPDLLVCRTEWAAPVLACLCDLL